jgi:hypothetical protein
MSKSEKPKTHFEQVPLEIVKKIVEEAVPDDETDEADVAVESAEKQ